MSSRRIPIAALLLVALGVAGWQGLRGLAGGGSRYVPPEPPRSVDPASRRTPPAGDVVGFVGRYGGHVWLGLPYAQPPAGERRWRPPEPAPRWEGTREALAFGPHCPQLPSAFAGVDGREGVLSGDEDCLVLNVYAPRFEPGALPSGERLLPVMVWIHGGGNTVGLSDFYDGGNLAVRENVIVVTVNYRLGPFGWFRHAALRGPDDGPAARSGNFGTLDLVRALEWVQENASAFGGDPSRVTIFGESAGGTNVFTLLLSPQAAGLFQRAIVQSGGARLSSVAAAENWSDDPEPGHARSSNEIAARLLVSAGQAKDRAGAKARMAEMPAAELAAFLRGRSAVEVFAAYETGDDEPMMDLPQLFADGAVLPAGDPFEHLGDPEGWNRVPVMVGTNRDEQKLFLFANPLYVRRWFGLIPRLRDPELFVATADAVSGVWKATGADRPAAAMRRTRPDVFVYRFDWDEEPTLFGVDLAEFLGASHGFEIPFVFGHWDLGRQGNLLFTEENRAGREALSAAMMSYWARFAETGDPGRGRRDELPVWTAWDPAPGGHKYAILDTPAGGGSRMGSEPTREEDVLAAVDRDPRLATPRERCFVLHEVVWRSLVLDRDGYAARCPEFPFDEFPWD
jgi:para-nitrobenzyl esterase